MVTLSPAAPLPEAAVGAVVAVPEFPVFAELLLLLPQPAIPLTSASEAITKALFLIKRFI
ncbi:hypothetical protein D3C73_1355420 [compost metagenome]